MSRGFLILLVLSIGVTSLLVTTWRDGVGVSPPTVQTLENERSTDGRLFFPSLASSLEDIERIEIRQGTATFALFRVQNNWYNSALSNYPAKGDLVESLLAKLAALTPRAPRTMLSQHYSKLDVGEPGSNSDSTQVTVKSTSSQILADIIVGRRQHRSISGSQRGSYVRLPQERQSWLADSALEIRRSAAAWSSREIARFDSDQLQWIELKPRDANEFALKRRNTSSEDDFELISVAAKTNNPKRHIIAYLLSLFDHLKFSDVRTADPSALERVAITARFQNGMTITIRAIETEALHETWATVSVSRQPDGPDSSSLKEQFSKVRAATEGWLFRFPAAVEQRFRLRLEDFAG